MGKITPVVVRWDGNLDWQLSIGLRDAQKMRKASLWGCRWGSFQRQFRWGGCRPNLMVSPTEASILNGLLSGGTMGGGALLGKVSCCGCASEGPSRRLLSVCFLAVTRWSGFLLHLLPLWCSASPGPETRESVEHELSPLKLQADAPFFAQVVSWVVCHSDENAHRKTLNAPAHVKSLLGGNRVGS